MSDNAKRAKEVEKICFAVLEATDWIKTTEVVAAALDAAEQLGYRRGVEVMRDGILKCLTPMDRFAMEAFVKTFAARLLSESPASEEGCGHICNYRCYGENGHHAWPTPCMKQGCPYCSRLFSESPVEVKHE